MSKHIKKFSPKLWLVHFHYIRAGMLNEVEELKDFKPNLYEPMLITDGGIYLMNEFYYKDVIKLVPYFQFIMGLSDDELEDDCVFIKYMHKKMPSTKRMYAYQTQVFIKYHNLEESVKFFKRLSNDEKLRRKKERS